MKNILKYSVLLLAGTAMLTSCDWTDPESTDLKYQTVKEVNPDAYTKYLAGLRAYRDNGHKKVYAWFENPGTMASQADHISAVPDSIDVLVFHNPDLIPQGLLNEMNTKRSETGMQMAYTVDYGKIRKAWELKHELGQGGEFLTFLNDSVAKALSYFDNGGFDRIIFAYDGKDMAAYGEADKAEYAAQQNAFLGKMSEWANSHIDKGFDFMGVPFNLLDQSLIAKAGIVFLSETATATNTDAIRFIITRNSVAGAPVEKFAAVAALPVLDETQASVGYWGDNYSSWVLARWSQNGPVAAMGLLNLRDDYFNPSFIYPVCREAIQILNPAAK